MKGSLFKLNKNRRYNYTPRYFMGKDDGNIYEFNSKFYKYRNNFNENDFSQQWKESRIKMRTRGNRSLSLRLIFIILFLIICFLYVIDFDLSIFSSIK
jgi:hypothetical protein